MKNIVVCLSFILSTYSFAEVDYDTFYIAGATSTVSYGYVAKIYKAHSQNPYKRYSGSWIEFEAVNNKYDNPLKFSSINEEIIKNYYIQKLWWTEAYMQDNSQEWAEQLISAKQSRINANLEKVKTYKRADRVAAKDASDFDNYKSYILPKVTQGCIIFPNKLAEITESIEYSYRYERSKEEVVEDIVSECQGDELYSQANVLARHFVRDFTKVTKDYGYIVGLDDFKEMYEKYPKALNVAKAVFNYLEDEADDVYSMVGGSDDFSVEELEFLPNKDEKLYWSSLGVGGGNGYDFVVKKYKGDHYEVVYADFDGDVLYIDEEFNITNFKNFVHENRIK